MSQDDEDLARPIYRTSRSFMHFANSSQDQTDRIAPDTSMITRLRDDGGSPPPVLPKSQQERDVAESSATTDQDVIESRQDEQDYENSQLQTATSSSPISEHSTERTSESPQGMKELLIHVRQVFRLSDDESLVAHYPAWLLKSVMLQGHIYITEKSLCFYAYMPRSDDITIKSGYLVKKSRTTSRHHRRWCILKNNILSYYENASDLYFPSGNIDLRQALTATVDLEPSSEPGYGFKLTTKTQEYFFRAETASAISDWIKVIKKVIFRLNNHGDSVKIVIPLASIFDVESSDVLHFTDTMKVRIADDYDTFAINEYFFSLFERAQEIIGTVRQTIKFAQESIVQEVGKTPQTTKPSAIYDTSKDAPLYEHQDILDAVAQVQASNPDMPSNIELIAQEVSGEQKKTHRTLVSNPFRNRASSRSSERSPLKAEASHADTRTGAVVDGQQKSPGKSSGVSKLIGSSLKSVSSIASSAMSLPGNILHSTGSNDAVNSDSPAADEATSERFNAQFGILDDERLLKAYRPHYSHRVTLIGDLYISDERICYRNSGPGSKIRIMLPMHDVDKAMKEKGFTFGFSGLKIVIRAHEDIFFEFAHSSDRDQCVAFINGAIENLGAKANRTAASRKVAEEQAYKAKEEYKLLERASKKAGGLTTSRSRLSQNIVSMPAIIFDSPSASLLAFKPTKQLRFTCLTIGSRGDVQPYVALCKGLIADGQRAKIATHEEFRDFVESHGIDFAPIEGNPAELMSICVEHGMFTYSFLKEASQKFRPWIDALLKSSWTACQNTDVLIESPSAMGGIHIAEALGVPYYRAFTMPWTKTRVYPHAFAVPDHSMGGNYNALTYTAFDNLFWKAISGQINRWRKKTLNLPATSYDKLAQHKVPFLYNFSPSVVPPARDWHEWIRVTGYWFLDGSDDKDGKEWEPPVTVVSFIKKAREQEKKLVYIGFGSIVVSDPKALTRAVVEAVRLAGVYCVLVKGWSGRSSHHTDSDDDAEEEKTPDSNKEQSETAKDTTQDDSTFDFGDQILSLDSIPHDWLFPQIDVACHHGGAGSLGASLRAGIPTIVKPFFGDQHFFGSRVHDLGVGVCLHSLTAKTLSEALVTCSTDKLINEKAHKIGEQLRSERGVENAIENIYRDLEYAKSLIKRPERPETGSSDSSAESYEHVEVPSEDADADDPDLFETKTDANGLTSTILKPFKSLRLPSPRGEKNGSYGLSGLKIFKSKTDV